LPEELSGPGPGPDETSAPAASADVTPARPAAPVPDVAAEEDEVDEEQDDVDETGRESFPASDPPSFWAGSDRRYRPGIR
jgi:hypothetical protein